MYYCKILKDLREDNDLTQEDIAKILNTTKQTYGRYENGTRKLSIEDLIKLSEFYKVSTDYILGKSKNKNNNEVNIKNQMNINGGKNYGKIEIK